MITRNAILHSFAYGLDFLREQVADVSPGDMVRQPTSIASHPAWQVGHLTVVCQNIGGLIGVKPWLAEDFVRRFETGSQPVADVGAYPAKAEALAMLADAQERVSRTVERLEEAALDRTVPDARMVEAFPTVRHALVQVLVGHTAYHVGQVTLWRKAMGLPAVRRAFE